MNIYSIILLTSASFLAATGQFLFKLGADGKSTLLEFVNAYIIFGLIFYGVGTCIWIYTLAKEQLLQVYPFTVLSFVLVMLAGFFILGERISNLGFFGISLIMIGLYFVTK